MFQMSRSYKKNPVCTDHKTPASKFSKRAANKRVRRNSFNLKKEGKSYKKSCETWNICDYRSRYSWKEWASEYGKDTYKIWYRYYKSK